MRGTGYFLICASAAALSSGAWAQATGDTDPIDPLASQTRSFEVEAEAAEAASKAKKDAADRTAYFVTQLKARRDAGGTSSSDVDKAIAELEARLLVERQSETDATRLATDLRKKADAARTALAALHIRFAPVSAEVTPKAPAPKVALRESSFGRTFEQIFDDPNDFMRPPRESKVGTPDTDQHASGEVSAASARSIGAGSVPSSSTGRSTAAPRAFRSTSRTRIRAWACNSRSRRPANI